MDIPALTTDQMREVDRLMVATFGIELLQMMENAGRSLAELSRRMLGGNAAGRRVTLLCGPGNNGGGGMVAARHLHGWGADVRAVLAADPDRLKTVPTWQWAALRKLGLEWPAADPGVSGSTPGWRADLVVDALLGYGSTGDPHPPVADWIRWANRQPAPVLSLDAPSGLDTTTGTAHDPTVRAAATLTLALPKTGLLAPGAGEFVGELYLADIGVPPELYAGPSFGLAVGAIFSSDTIIRVV
jgi:NAD(P)H-hydrate epimerase